MPCDNGSTFENASDFQLHLIQGVLKERASGNDTHVESLFTQISNHHGQSTVNALQRRRIVCFKHYNPSTEIFRVRTKSTTLHNAAQEWLSRSQQAWLSTYVLTLDECNMFIITSNSLFRFTNGPWADTMKAPDISVQLSTTGLPQVTFECDFPESHDILQHDMVDWLMGGDGAVQAVVLVKWKPCPTTMTVWGDVELYARDTNKILRLQQREQVFLVPEGLEEPQVLRLSRQKFFRGNIAPGRAECDVFGLDIQVLRTVATMLMADMGHAPV